MGFRSRTLTFFFSFFCAILLFFLVLVCLLCVSHTSPPMTFSFGISSSRRDHIYLSCAFAFDSLILRQAHPFYSSVDSLWLLVISIHAKSRKTSFGSEWFRF